MWKCMCYRKSIKRLRFYYLIIPRLCIKLSSMRFYHMKKETNWEDLFADKKRSTQKNDLRQHFCDILR